MYVKRSFAMSDDEAIALLQKVSAADIVSQTDDGLVATFMPFIWDPSLGEHGALLTHMMRVNTQWRDSRGEVLVIARGVDHHVTSDWLPAGDKVPTWNYEAVHVHGELVVHDDVDFCRDVVTRTVAHLEPTWRVESSGEDIEPMLRAIVGLEIRVTRLEAKAKLSQNKTPEVLESIIAGLEAKGMHADAEAIRVRSLPVSRERQALVDAARARHGR